jgi:2-polyprenyl-3-methyl-5-hydroxy-6-metoxy-1,4-benzoquinol methylase
MNATEYMNDWRQVKGWSQLSLPYHQGRFKRCVSLLVGDTFIDVGCACGHSTNYMNKFHQAQWFGMDFDQGGVDEARKLFPKYEFIYSPDYDMVKAAAGRTFDTVVCSEVIEHIEDDAAFVRGLILLACRRVVITTPNVRVKDPGHLRSYMRGMLAELLEGTGRVRVLSEGRFFYAVIDFRPGGAR